MGQMELLPAPVGHRSLLRLLLAPADVITRPPWLRAGPAHLVFLGSCRWWVRGQEGRGWVKQAAQELQEMHPRSQDPLSLQGTWLHHRCPHGINRRHTRLLVSPYPWSSWVEEGRPGSKEEKQ